MRPVMLACLGVIWLAGVAVAAQDKPDELFYQANTLYEKGEYETAAELYRQIIESGMENWQVYYNLGNASFRLNRIGEAVLNYERALKLNPENDDIRYNLEIANLSVVDRIPEPPQQPVIAWILRQFNRPSFTGLVYALLSFYAIFVLLLALPMYFPRLGRGRAYRLSRAVSLSFAVLFAGIVLFRWYGSETRQFGVILAPQVRVTSSPAADATEVFVLHEGVRLEIEEQSGEWLRIRLRDGKIGWVPQQAVGKI